MNGGGRKKKKKHKKKEDACMEEIGWFGIYNFK